MSFAPPVSISDEVLDFLATALTAEEIIAFQPSENVKQLAAYLLERSRESALTDEEREEMEEFRRMNHFVNMLKLRTRQNLMAS